MVGLQPSRGALHAAPHPPAVHRGERASERGSVYDCSSILRLRDQHLHLLHQLVHHQLGRRLVLQRRGLRQPRLIFVVAHPLLQQRLLGLQAGQHLQLGRGVHLLWRECGLHHLPFTVRAAAACDSAIAACGAAFAPSIAAVCLRDQQLLQLHQLVHHQLGW